MFSAAACQVVQEHHVKEHAGDLRQRWFLPLSRLDLVLLGSAPDADRQDVLRAQADYGAQRLLIRMQPSPK
jgi:hypothetical protein